MRSLPELNMSDDLKKKKIDAWFLNLNEKYEVTYFVNDILKEVPTVTKQQVLDALYICADAVKPSEGRAKIKACVLKKLTGR